MRNIQCISTCSKNTFNLLYLICIVINSTVQGAPLASRLLGCQIFIKCVFSKKTHCFSVLMVTLMSDKSFLVSSSSRNVTCFWFVSVSHDQSLHILFYVIWYEENIWSKLDDVIWLMRHYQKHEKLHVFSALDCLLNRTCWSSYK